MIDNLPLIVSIHEGSWYPASCCGRHCTRSRALARETAEQCPFGGWCTIEESVLPSFAWQQFPKLASKARPQLIARVIVPPRARPSAAIAETPARLRRSSST